MPLDPEKAREQWLRYVYSRDTGHRSYLVKANKCEDFFCGAQWDPAVKAQLDLERRPALTINKVLITLASIFGEQIDTRSEISFRPRFGAPPQNADIMTKVARAVSDENQLDWVRSEVFADGCVTSRGYYDVRLKFESNVAGEISVSRVNPRCVLPDPDASDYDPATWNDVIVTSWVTPDDIELLYNRADARALESRSQSAWTQGYDALDSVRDRFGSDVPGYLDTTDSMRSTLRSIRMIDRQHRVLTRSNFFVDPKTGDKMLVPERWGDAEIRHAVNAGGLIVSKELHKRVRWMVTADDFVLHDAWSPFTRFTIVPYFPYFRYGRTVGLVESLIDPQELLNKTLSQELHIVNTMANSGWKVRTGAIQNMTTEELEQFGAKTGLVLEVNGDPDKDVVKIQPNAIPSGLDRLSFKAEQYVKTVSGRGDNQLGLTRPDQSGKLAEESNKSSDVSLRKALDNLERTDFLLGNFFVELIQNFYTDHRIMHITRDELTGELEQVSVNLPDPATGEILNDLSLGSYDTVITSQVARRTLEESEFASALGLREIGIKIPDRFMVENSNLRKKGEIVKAMEAEASSPEAQEEREVVRLGRRLELTKLKAETSSEEAEGAHKRAKTAKEIAETQQLQSGDAGERAKAEAERAKAQAHVEEKQADMSLEKQRHDQEMQFLREKHALELRLKEEAAATDRKAKLIAAVAQAKQAAKAPASSAAQQQQ